MLGWILIGLVTGSLAQSVTGVEKRGCLYSIVVGVIGSLVGGALFRAAGVTERVPSFFVAFIGACVFCFALKFLSRRR
jgi:uncharacterized membrane protein YeaQ/YmgE (transglycosylase-associated protein family)